MAPRLDAAQRRTRRRKRAELGSGNTHKRVTFSIMSVRCMFSRNQAGRPSVVISEPTVYNSTPSSNAIY